MLGSVKKKKGSEKNATVERKSTVFFVKVCRNTPKIIPESSYFLEELLLDSVNNQELIAVLSLHQRMLEIMPTGIEPYDSCAVVNDAYPIETLMANRQH